MPTKRFDPLPAFCFSVKMTFPSGEEAIAFCKSAHGIGYEREVIPYKEGGDNVLVPNAALTLLADWLQEQYP